MDVGMLIQAAMDARRFSYSPYSQFAVGAAIITGDGRIYSGCNVENASYGAAVCAERTALFKAVSEGERSFEAIAVVGGKAALQIPEGYAFPCGMCRQVMSEFCGPDLRIIVARVLDDYREYTLGQLLPESFGADQVADGEGAVNSNEKCTVTIR